MSDQEVPSEVEVLLREINEEIEKEVNEKVTKAMRLFLQVDNFYQGIVLHNIRPKLPLTARTLRDAFEMADLFDTLDTLIEDLEDEIASGKELN